MAKRKLTRGIKGRVPFKFSEDNGDIEIYYYFVDDTPPEPTDNLAHDMHQLALWQGHQKYLERMLISHNQFIQSQKMELGRKEKHARKIKRIMDYYYRAKQKNSAKYPSDVGDDLHKNWREEMPGFPILEPETIAKHINKELKK